MIRAGKRLLQETSRMTEAEPLMHRALAMDEAKHLRPKNQSASSQLIDKAAKPTADVL